MTSATRSILSILILTAASPACELAPSDEAEEGPVNDMEVSPAALKLKPSLLLEAGTVTQNVLGVYAWEVSTDKEETMVLGFATNGRRVLTARISQRDPKRDVGRVTFQGERKPLKFSFDKNANRLTVSDDRALKLIDVINAYGRDQAAGKVLKKYDASNIPASCVACAFGSLTCISRIGTCSAATAATGGLAVLWCGASIAGACGITAYACYQCASTAASSAPPVDVQVVPEEKSPEIKTICFRWDPCWCQEHPDQCFSPVES